MSQKEHTYPPGGAWLLDNPIRRWIQPPSEFVEKLGIAPQETVMDFGCGPGYFTVELAKKAKKVVAVDLSEEMLKKAQRKNESARVGNVEFLHSDGKKIQLKDASVDLILLVTVFHEIGDTATVLEEFGRILKPTGKLVVVEVIKKMLIPGAPIQNPQVIQAKVEAVNFQLQQTEPYKSYGIFFFTKKL